MPARTRETARVVIAKVVDDVEKRLGETLRQAVSGALNRSAAHAPAATARHRLGPDDPQANLRHYQPAEKTIIPETLIGHGRQPVGRARGHHRGRPGGLDGGIGRLLGGVRRGHGLDPLGRDALVVFDTAVVDLTDELATRSSPVRDPARRRHRHQRAVGYCQALIRRPTDTIFVLISDLYEGGIARRCCDGSPRWSAPA